MVYRELKTKSWKQTRQSLDPFRVNYPKALSPDRGVEKMVKCVKSTLVGSLGVDEMLSGRPSRHEDAHAMQREDFVGLGRLLLQLACCTPQHMSLEYCASHFSAELTRLIASLLGHQEPITSWRQVLLVSKQLS